MRSRTTLLAAAAAGLAGLVVSPAPAATRDAGVRLLACQQAREPAARNLVVEAHMRAGSAAERLEVRFDLHHRAEGGAPAVRVSGPGLGIYNRAAAGVATFRFRKRIANLVAAGDYRVIATFRWLSPSGRPLYRVVRVGPACHQAELRPDLLVSSIAPGPEVEGGRRTYFVTVRNAGASRAGGFAVALLVAGAPQGQATLPGLAAGQTRRVAIVAPTCPAGAALTAVADPGRRVPEASETNNVHALPCAGAPPPG